MANISDRRLLNIENDRGWRCMKPRARGANLYVPYSAAFHRAKPVRDGSLNQPLETINPLWINRNCVLERTWGPGHGKVKGVKAKALFIILVTSHKLLFIGAPPLEDSQRLDYNFRHVVNYCFEFCSSGRLNGCMGNILWAAEQSSGTHTHTKRGTQSKTERGGEWREDEEEEAKEVILTCFV